MTATIHVGDCREILAGFEPDSIDACVCDPPYELGFMGKSWDRSGVSFDPATWAAVLRVLKPGGHLVAFGGTRTYHRIACAIEDAGFEIRDSLVWLYGSGFPKSLNVSIAIDKAAGAMGHRGKAIVVAGRSADGQQNLDTPRGAEKHEPITDAAKQWDGFGTALKPAMEPIVLARKPLTGTVAANVGAHGVGALNIDACRIEATARPRIQSDARGGSGIYGNDAHGSAQIGTTDLGRWPANVLLDEQAASALDEQSGTLTTHGSNVLLSHAGLGFGGGNGSARAVVADSGGASRFFYTSKAGRAEREEGLCEVSDYDHSGPRGHAQNGDESPRPRPRPRANVHPTVKPVALMRWLCRLITPPGGLILDPFAGSGTTGKAAVMESFRFVGVELDERHAEIARGRIRAEETGAIGVASTHGQLGLLGGTK